MSPLRAPRSGRAPLTRRRRVGAVLLLGAGLLAVRVDPAAAQPAQDPDWPCVQRLVPELSYALLWTGPSPEPYFGTWDEDPARAALVRKVTRLATPAEDARQAVREHLRDAGDTAEGADEGTDEATALFAGIFQEIQARRQEAIAAAKRYSRGQKALLDQIAGHLQTLDRLLDDSADTAAARIDDVQRELKLTRQIFDSRRRALKAVCEQSVLLEQRLGQLEKAITAARGG